MASEAGRRLLSSPPLESFFGNRADCSIREENMKRWSISAANAYEVNIWDKRPEPDYGTGAIVNIAKVNPMPKAAGKWNVYEITAKGDTLTVTLNGQKTVDGVKDAKHASGRVALQHGLGLKDDKGVANDKGVVKFRKVEIKPL